jgi:hypothetical protein
MSKTPFMWKAEPGSTLDSAFSAQLGNVIYHVVSRTYGHPAYLEVRGPRGSLKRLDLGFYVKMQACERHYAAGCDLSKAEKPRRDARGRRQKRV